MVQYIENRLICVLTSSRILLSYRRKENWLPETIKNRGRGPLLQKRIIRETSRLNSIRAFMQLFCLRFLFFSFALFFAHFTKGSKDRQEIPAADGRQWKRQGSAGNHTLPRAPGSTSPYSALATVPLTITGPAMVNIFTIVPVTRPSACVKENTIVSKLWRLPADDSSRRPFQLTFPHESAKLYSKGGIDHEDQILQRCA